MALDDIVKGVANMDNDNSNTPNSEILKKLDSIDNTLKAIAAKPGNFSQSFANDRAKETSNTFRDFHKFSNKSSSNSSKGFLDAFEDELMEGLFGSNFKKEISNILDNFAKSLGTDINGLGGKLGKELASQGLSAFKSTKFGASAFNKFDSLKQKGMSFASSKLQSGAAFINNGGIAKLGAQLGKMSLSMPHLALAVSGAAVAFFGLKSILGGVGSVFKGLSTMIKGLSEAANRDSVSREKNLKLAQQRLIQDIETMVKTPFQILEKAASEIYSQWDNNLRTIGGTQGYTKSSLQDLMSAFASRLRDEGLSSVIAGTDITDGLAQVLKAGLSGKIAEEFAYQAVKMNAAVPTHNFFGYASTYASIAANAIKSGKSQQAAIEQANKSLSEFTSGLLYASRTLSGGMTTGLTNAQSIYDTAAKIAQTAKVGDVSEISGVLLAVQGVLGATSPDLASSIVDTITKTLIGGNSSDVVALRSLSGVNASNTEFLQAFANNPKAIMSSMFSNLAKMYTSNGQGAYMEKAEGYSDLFGISQDAFARINFSDVASAISNMSMSEVALSENIKLLASGQTTTSAEQLKMQQINKYMIDEGLSYVLDNEAARQIQQHMWDEQMQRELVESTFSVNLTGAAAEALEAIKQGVNNVINFLNPFAWFKKIGNIIGTFNEASGHSKDIKQLLELGKVGQGNAKSLHQLMTRNANLGVAPNLVGMMGGTPLYKLAQKGLRRWNTLTNPFLALTDNKAYSGQTGEGLQNLISSQYSFGIIGKSNASVARQLLGSGMITNLASVKTLTGTTAKSKSAVATNKSIAKLLADDYIVNNFVNKGKSYEDWAASTKSAGITNLSQALSDAGYTESQVREYFSNKETEKGVSELHQIREHEKLFRETGIAFWNEKFPTEFKDPLFELVKGTNTRLDDVIKHQDKFETIFKTDWIEKGWGAYVSIGNGSSGIFNKFYNEFMKYFVNHYYYSNTKGYKFEDVTKIQKDYQKQEQGAIVTELANVLTNNLLDLSDPQMQTNALLAQILVITKAIMNQNNQIAGTTGQSALLDSLSAMALGITTNTP